MRTHGFLKDVPGGISRVMKELLPLAFFDPAGHDASSAGVRLKLIDGSYMRIWLALGMIIADESALHSVYQCKGSSGLKPCLLCQNVFDAKSVRGIVERDATGFAVDHTCHGLARLVSHTPATILAIQQRLQRQSTVLAPQEFAELQTCLGWNYAPEGLMQHDLTRVMFEPCTRVCFDWMHVFFVGGLFNVHVGRLLSVLASFKISIDTVESYVAEWRWPKRVAAAHISDLFAKSRRKSGVDDATFKASASQGLSLLPVLASFMRSLHEKTPVAELQQHALCFLLLARIVELILRSARVRVDPSDLRAALTEYMERFLNLFGKQSMIIKFHYAMHFPGYLERWGFVPGCFALERKHKVGKRFANEIRNTRSHWEASVLREVTNHHVFALCGGSHFSVDASLVDAGPLRNAFAVMLQQQLGPFESAETAKCARVNAWEKCHVGDVVMFRSTAAAGSIMVGEIQWHVSFQQGGLQYVVSCIRTWDLIKDLPASCKWHRSDGYVLCHTCDIVCSLIWSGEDVMTTLKPPVV